MNILYLADPNSIHDIKWIRFFCQKNHCYLLVRNHHAKQYGSVNFKQLAETENIHFVGEIDDFSIKRFLHNYKIARQIKRIIQTYNIDIFHILYAEPNALWAFYRKKLGVPIILTTRGSDVLRAIPAFFNNGGILNKVVAYFYRKAFRNIEEITSTSIRQKEGVLNILGREKNIHIIRTGVDVQKIQGNTSQYQLTELKAKKYVFFPRAMRPLYQHELAVQAIAKLSAELRKNYSFVFVNKDSRDRGYIALIQKEMDKVDANFVWTNNLEQLTLFETYKGASLVVMTPKSDGTPVTAIEAMLCKVPLVLPPLRYDEDIFEDTVFQFENWTAESLAKTMTEAMTENNEERLELALERAETLADRQKEMTKLWNIYQQYATAK